MSQTEWVSDSSSHPRVLFKSALLAILLEAILVTSFGWHEHWLAHPKKVSDESRFIEAQVFQMPSEAAHLVEEKKAAAPAQKPEQTLSKTPGKGTPTSKTNQTMEEENKTVSGPKLAPTHGPVAVFSPPPVIPPYLQDKEIKTHVVIDFYISSQGIASPRLAGSSGNEELDAIALGSVKKWVFRPAEKDGKPVDSKVRLRIVFVVQ
jgi:TonB family protein